MRASVLLHPKAVAGPDLIAPLSCNPRNLVLHHCLRLFHLSYVLASHAYYRPIASRSIILLFAWLSGDIVITCNPIQQLLSNSHARSPRECGENPYQNFISLTW